MKGYSNLLEMFEQSTDTHAKRVALVFGRRKISYATLRQRTEKLATFLHGLGVRKHDRVALWLPNCPEFVYSFFATLRLGATVVPINSMFRQEEARFIIEDARAKVLISSIEKFSASSSLRSRIATLEHLISSPGPEGGGVMSVSGAIAESDRFSERTIVEDDDIAEIVYTSGTTGSPKGACLTHRNLAANIIDSAHAIGVTKKDAFICILPLFHSFASTVCMMVPLSQGSKVVIMRTVRPFKRVIRSIFKNRVTIFAGVPSIFNILSEAKFPRKFLILSFFLSPIRLCISGAAALPVRVTRKFEQRFKRPLLQGYGLTEASPVVSLNPFRGKRKPSSVGLPYPSIEVRVIDKDGNDLPIGSVGELLVKGPNVMQGYYHLPEATKKAIVDGWLHTGDLAKLDEQGYIYIMGRIKDMINVRGLNVYPKEIEDLLYRYPQVREAAVVGVDHRRRGEVPVAFIVKEGELKEKVVAEFLRKNLAPYKVPLRIFFRESLPKNPTGKILKRELQREIESLFR